MSVLKVGHLTIGWTVLALFAASGVYLRVRAPAVYLGDEVSHMMFIANHIYLLMAGIANVAIGRYVVPVIDKRGKLMQSVALAAMTASSLLLAYAFMLEPMLGSLERPRTQIGVILLAVGTLLHALSNLPGRQNRK